MADEGYVEVEGGRVWYRRLGGGEALPVLLLHGGPGAAHDYMLPLAERLSEHRPAIVYDQLGCGRSDRPDDTSLWTVDRSVTELDHMREALGLERCHLLGQSWGGWLAIDYMARGQAGIVGLVLASTSASIEQFVAGARGEYDDPDYRAAEQEFYRRHLCRMDPWPEALVRSSEQMEGNQVYATMNGPTEFDVIGRLRTWDRTSDLPRIDVPTLVTCGRYDEITPACAETIAEGIPDARMVVFEESAHVAHLEEPEAYASTVEAFLASVESRAAV